MKNKNIVIYAIIGALLAGGFFLMTSGNNSGGENYSSYSASVLAASESSFNFDKISMSDGIVSHKFKLTNNGLEPVKIGKVYTSCMCTTAYIIDSSGKKYGKFGMPGHNVLPRADLKVAPGETIIVQAIYDPAAHGPSGVGLARRSIYLETNSQKNPKVELKISAMVER